MILNNLKYINHKVTEMMFRNNKDFYDDVFNKKFDIRLFKRSLNSDENMVAFLAFGKIFGEDVIRLLARWAPNYRAQFWWFVIKRHILKKKYYINKE